MRGFGADANLIVLRRLGLVAPWWGLFACALSHSAGGTSPTPPKSAAPEGPPEVQVLLDRTRIRYDEAGARRTERHLSVRLLSGAAIDRWSKLGVTWSPNRSTRPELQAVVIHPDGSRTTLGPERVVDEPMPEGPGLVRRFSALELPGLGIGAVIEEHLVIEERPGPLLLGYGGRALIGDKGPVERFELELEVPITRPLDVQVVGSGLVEQIEEHDGRRHFRYAGGPFPALAAPPPLAPLGPLPAGVYFGAPGGWGALGAAYGARVEAALGPRPTAARSPGPESPVIVEALLALERSVRALPTPLTLEGEAPRALAEIRENRQGDALDRALVLIAELRQRGLRAHLGLVARDGEGEQPHPELAELSVFDRVVVAVPVQGGVRYLDPLGGRLHLPAELEGRACLFTGPEPGWRMLPRGTSEANRYRERRRIRLGEYGPVEVEELTLGEGTIEDQLRAQLEGPSDAELLAILEAYARTAYGASGPIRFRRTVPTGPEQDFRLELGIQGAMIGFTGTKEAQVQLRGLALYTALPSYLRRLAFRDPARAEAEGEVEPLQLRTTDVELPMAYSAEIVIDVELPEGFVARTLPEDRQLQLGPARYRQRFTRTSSTTVRAELSFDTQKSRYTPAEARALVQGLRDLASLGHPTLDLEHRGSTWLAEGHIGEGLREYAQLAKAHPGSAVHRARFAEALLSAHLGEAARTEAHAAVALAPTSAMARYTLGWVLSHDLYGRQYRRGFDRARALAAFQQVLELEPNNREARLSLALLYEHDPEGRRYADVSALEAAIGEYERLHADGADVGESLLEAHFWAGHYDAVEALAQSLPGSRGVSTFALAARAMLGRPSESLDTRGDPEVEKVQAAAAQVLVRLGRYPEARRLLESGGDGEAERRAVLRHLEVVAPPVPPPAEVVEQLLERLIHLVPSDVPLSQLYARSAQALYEEEVPALQAELERAVESQGPSSPRRLLLDLGYGQRHYQVEGDERLGYYVKVVSPGAPRLIGRGWWVIKEGGRWVIAAARSAPFSFGVLALLRLTQGDRAGARAVLDRARQELVDDGDSGHFGRLWPSPRPLDPAQLRTIAAALLVTGPTVDRAIRILEPARPKGLLAEVLGAAYLKVGAYPALLTLAEGRLAQDPADVLGRAWQIRAWTELGQLDQAKAALLRALNQGEGLDALHGLAELALQGGHFEEARVWLERIEGRSPSPEVLNNLAWVALLEGQVDNVAVRRAQEANQATQFASPAELHTLAALHAARGEPRPALELLMRRADVLLAYEPEPADWFVIGRVLEGYGLFDAALAAYERADRGSSRPDSTDRLAADRRAHLLRGGAAR